MVPSAGSQLTAPYVYRVVFRIVSYGNTNECARQVEHFEPQRAGPTVVRIAVLFRHGFLDVPRTPSDGRPAQSQNIADHVRLLRWMLFVCFGLPVCAKKRPSHSYVAGLAPLAPPKINVAAVLVLRAFGRCEKNAHLCLGNARATVATLNLGRGGAQTEWTSVIAMGVFRTHRSKTICF